MTDTATSPSASERNWAVAAHLSGLLGLAVWAVGIVLGPLIVWLIKKDEMPFLNDQGREALNFQITIFLAGVVCSALIFLLIGVPLLFALAIFDLVFMIIGAVKASDGVAYRYPVNLRLVK
ncbi:MAG TPA: DUF4870 domain-containing protein [Steroidobacteraceae bacterium]